MKKFMTGNLKSYRVQKLIYNVISQRTWTELIGYNKMKLQMIWIIISNISDSRYEAETYTSDVMQKKIDKGYINGLT